jgi:hypothetical protein
MKTAVIVVGKARSGKSTTIREFKSIVAMQKIRSGVSYHVFNLHGQGYILSTSFEEMPRRNIEATVKRLSKYYHLIFACRGQKLSRLHEALRNAGFTIKDIEVQWGVSTPRKKAMEIVGFFNSRFYAENLPVSN